MRILGPAAPSPRFSAACLLAAGVLAAVAGAGFAADAPVVRQLGRMFIPARIAVPRGTTVRFVNEEALVHHAFVDAPGFAVDSGDIAPNETAALLFDRQGRFTVRCAIHPQMSLEVEVVP